MIKTPVSYDSVNQCVIDAEGDELFASDAIYDCEAQEIVKRINMHDELVLMLKDIALVDGGSECIKSKRARARKLLEKIK